MRVSATDRMIFGRAAGAAFLGEHERVRVGAILTRGRVTLRTGHNRVAVGIEGEPFYDGHAERQVIDGQAAFKGTLYVARIQLNDTLAASWPCDECMVYIKSCACVSKIVYHDGETIRKVRL